MRKVVAILCADLHLSHTPPVARSAEPDWYAAQGRYLEQLREIAERHDAPILCAGDVFDRWQSCPELVNWTIEWLPKMYAIPGQHDLPHHSLDEIRKSAYWTLVEAKVIRDLEFGESDLANDIVYLEDQLAVYGFPFGNELQPNRTRDEGHIHVAVAHRYVWTAYFNYPGAAPESHVKNLRKQLESYDVAVFGDNHKPFESHWTNPPTMIFNCGCLIPRSIDERHIRPSVGLLFEDKHIERCCLDVSQDKWIDGPVEQTEQAETNEELVKFLDDLKTLGDTALDFHRAVIRFMSENKVDDGVRKALLEAMEGR